MIHLEIEQGSPEWHRARLGIPTASMFSKIVTPTGNASSEAKEYRIRLLTEWLTGEPQEGFSGNAWTRRGKEFEQEARTLYELESGIDTQPCGVIFKDASRSCAASPDWLEPNSGGEIKCPAAWTHVGYLLEGVLPTEYVPQVQGCMYVTGFPEWRFVSYHPKMADPLILTVKRDDEYIEKLEAKLKAFTDKLNQDKAKLYTRGIRPKEVT